MGVPIPGMDAGESQSAEALLAAFETLDARERRRHAEILSYWLSLRGDRDFPGIRDLDPLEISDAAPFSLLLELIGGGEDAELRHVGEALKPHGGVDKISEAARPSLLSAIAAKLGIVAISRNFLAFEDEFADGDISRRCWITLLPFSSTGAWVDYVYAVVTLDSAEAEAEAKTESEIEPVAEELAVEPEADSAEPEREAEPEHEPIAEPDEAVESELSQDEEALEEPIETVEAALPHEEEPVAELPAAEAEEPETIAEPAEDPVEEPAPEKRPGFSKLLDAIAGVGGFHGTHVRVEPTLSMPEADTVPEEPAMAEAEPVIDLAEEEPAAEPVETAPAEPVAGSRPDQTFNPEDSLDNRLTQVRARAEEARDARLAAERALIDGLSAAYDFALDAEGSPEDYLRLVEAQGLKIQLRAPMAPVVRLVFDGQCDEPTIGQMEKVMAWALKQELPRGALAGRIESAGGIEQLAAETAAD